MERILSDHPGRPSPTRNERSPYKREASYYSIRGGGKRGKNAVWSYESPHPAVAGITDHLAFYPDRVDAIEVEN